MSPKLSRSATGRAAIRLRPAGSPTGFPPAGCSRGGSLWGHWSQLLNSTYGGDTRTKFWLKVHSDLESVGYDPDEPDAYQRQANHLKRNWHRKASITYEATPEVSITGADVELDTAPRLPLRTRATERVTPSVIPELLEELEQLIGTERAEPVARRAEELAEVAGQLGTEVLERTSRDGRRALRSFERGATLELERVESGLAVAQKQTAAARQRVAQLELAAQSNQLHGLRGWRRRKQLLEQAAAQRPSEQDERKLARLTERVAQLKGERDEFVRGNGEQLARASAAERVLTDRREREPVSVEPPAPDLGREAGETPDGPGVAI